MHTRPLFSGRILIWARQSSGWSPCAHSRFSSALCFTPAVSMSGPFPQCIPSPVLLSAHTFFCLCLCLYFCFENKFIYTIFIDSTYMHYNWFFFLFMAYFNLYWQSLGSSMTLQMAQFYSFLWLGNIAAVKLKDAYSLEGKLWPTWIAY